MDWRVGLCVLDPRNEEDRESVNSKLVKRVSAQWWMPRHGPARKDVASCEKLRGAARERRSGDVRMGKPGGSDPVIPLRGEANAGN